MFQHHLPYKEKSTSTNLLACVRQVLGGNSQRIAYQRESIYSTYKYVGINLNLYSPEYNLFMPRVYSGTASIQFRGEGWVENHELSLFNIIYLIGMFLSFVFLSLYFDMNQFRC